MQACCESSRSLLQEVYRCTACATETYGSLFRRPAADQPYYKFPHRIGAPGEAPVLFVGMNPRRDPDSNKDLSVHDAVMASQASFTALAANRLKGSIYVGRQGIERHYRTHVEIAELAFPEKNFDDVAVATEIFLCATKNGKGLPFDRSPCGDRFLAPTILEVRPKVIVALGQQVLNYFRTRFRIAPPIAEIKVEECTPIVISIAHPNDHSGRSSRERRNELLWAGQAIRAVIDGTPVPDKADVLGRREHFRLTEKGWSDQPRYPSVKAGILRALRGLPSGVSLAEFIGVVESVMRYDPASATFGVATRFPTLRVAARAWLNQLRKESLLTSQES